MFWAALSDSMTAHVTENRTIAILPHKPSSIVMGCAETSRSASTSDHEVVSYDGGMSDSKSPVYHAPADDPAMAVAMRKARATFKYLWRELTWEYRRIVPAVELAAVKAAFGDAGGGPDDVEHMWLGEIHFDGDAIGATLLNEPNQVRSVRAGDGITLAPDQIEDWMYVMGGRVYGGFTIHTMRARMSLTERRAHDEAWGFDFGDPNHVALVPSWTPGADPEAEHPMSENMAQGLAEAIDANPVAFLVEADERGLTTLHSLALGGSAAGVRVLLEKGADPSQRTKSGKTARDFAEQMGWPRVIELLNAAERRGRA